MIYISRRDLIQGVGAGPRAIEYNPSNEDMYVLNNISQDVLVIDSDTNTVNETIDVGSTPQSLEYSPSNENIYIVNQGSDYISVIQTDTNTISETIDVGSEPSRPEYDPTNEYVYITNEFSDNVSVVGPDQEPPPPTSEPSPFEGILGSGNNFGFQIQENSGNNVGG